MCDTAAVVQVCGPTAQSVAFFNTNNATPKSKTSIQPCIIGKFKTMFPETCNYCQSSNLTANTNILGIIQSNFLVNKVTCSSTAQYPDEACFQRCYGLSRLKNLTKKNTTQNIVTLPSNSSLSCHSNLGTCFISQYFYCYFHTHILKPS